MLFQEALAELKAGESVCRESWSLSEGYLVLMKGMKYVWKIVIEPTNNAGNFIFCVDDFEASDWVRFQVPETVEGELLPAPPESKL